MNMETYVGKDSCGYLCGPLDKVKKTKFMHGSTLYHHYGEVQGPCGAVGATGSTVIHTSLKYLLCISKVYTRNSLQI